MTAKRMILLPERHSLIQINCILTKQDLIESEKTRVVAISGATFGGACYVSVRRSVEAVAPHAFGMQFAWNGNPRARGGRDEGRVETCNLRQGRKLRKQRSHRREIERLVQWRQRHVTLELMQRLGIEAHRAVELVATIPPDQAFCPLERSRCSLVGK